MCNEKHKGESMGILDIMLNSQKIPLSVKNKTKQSKQNSILSESKKKVWDAYRVP